MEQFPTQAIKNVNFYIFAVAIFLTIKVYSLTYYCVHGNNVDIQGETNGTIKTLVNGQSLYGNNMNCSWTLDAGVGNRVRLKTLTFDLQYTPPYVSCYGNDYLQIHNGNNHQSSILGSFCGRNNPYEIVSQGRYLYLTFSTNDKNFYNHAGIAMDFQVFANNACPPEWNLFNSDQTCIKLMLNPNTGADWSDSQKYCGYSQSNLATYATQSVFDFVQANLSQPGTSHAWVGLNDILKEDNYKWMDDSSPSSDIKAKYDTYISSSLDDCVIHNFVTETLISKQCDRDSYHFLCLQKQDGSTIVYKAPEAPTETTKFDKKKTSFTWMIILGILAGCLLILIVIFFIVRKKLKDSRENQAQLTHTAEEQTPFQSTNQEPGPSDSTNQRGDAQPSAPPMDAHEHPPTYEETIKRKRYSPETQAWIVSVIAIVCLFIILAVYLTCRLRRRTKQSSSSYRSPHIDIQEEVGETLLTDDGLGRCRAPPYPLETPAPQQVLVQPFREGDLQNIPPPTYSEVVTSA